MPLEGGFINLVGKASGLRGVCIEGWCAGQPGVPTVYDLGKQSKRSKRFFAYRVVLLI